MSSTYLLLVLYFFSASADYETMQKDLNCTVKISTTESPIGCACGIFLSGQFKKGSKQAPMENPVLLHDLPGKFACNAAGNRLCISKCVDTVIKYLPGSPKILCSSIEHDCYKERAHLFIKNCKDEWINTNLSAGRQYCCKDGTPYRCPL